MARDVPERSCIGCRTRRGSDALVRITGSDRIVVDGPSSGRGAWLCRDADGVNATCFDQARRNGRFARAWRRRVDDEELDAVQASILARELSK